MEQVYVKMTTYTADVSGACSALYELGGMVVIHDPSGCNSTYNTHDEPRWYDMDSLVFISGLREIDAIMGNDDKFIHDVEEAAGQLKPRFITLLRTPVPLLTGTDFDAIAHLVEEDTGIPTFYIPTSGMQSYIDGAGRAFEKIAQLVKDGGDVLSQDREGAPARPGVNLLGVTPLDFSVGSTVDSMRTFVAEKGFRLISCMAMGSTPEEIALAGSADVNLVVSSTGLPAAKVLKRRFGTPYVVGMPCGSFGETLANDMNAALQDRRDIFSCESAKESEEGFCILGEYVTSASIAKAILMRSGKRPRVICPVGVPEGLPTTDALITRSEKKIAELLKRGKTVIADPMYRRYCPDGVHFIDLPHEACSGRIYRKQIPDLVNLKLAL